jgi:hypothetical protein
VTALLRSIPAGRAEPAARRINPAYPLADVSCRVVLNYARRNEWIDLHDLEHEASVASLEARQSWRPDGGMSRNIWEARLVALSRFVAEERSPVSLPKYKGNTWEEASRAQRISIEGNAGGSCNSDNTHGETPASGRRDSPDVARVAAEQFEPLEERIDLARAALAIRRVMDEQSAAAAAVLLGEEKSSAVADRLSMPTRDVYEQTARAMRALRAAFCPTSTAERRVP